MFQKIVIISSCPVLDIIMNTDNNKCSTPITCILIILVITIYIYIYIYIYVCMCVCVCITTYVYNYT